MRCSRCRISIRRHRLSGHGRELSVFSFQFSVFSFQFSVFSFQFSVFSSSDRDRPGTVERAAVVGGPGTDGDWGPNDSGGLDSAMWEGPLFGTLKLSAGMSRFCRRNFLYLAAGPRGCSKTSPANFG
jgi:hypothetical protein